MAIQPSIAGKPALIEGLATALPGSLPLIGHSDALEPVDRFVERAARVDFPAWIRGEAGTEKDFVAFAIHAASPRNSGPFVPIRCGMSTSRISRQLRQAAGGTVFLQDVDALGPALQRQVLGLLAAPADERDFRVLSSSTEDLHALACAGSFSRPLVEVLCCLALVLPPLRERSGDIEALVEFFAARQLPRGCFFSDELMVYLRHYPWPGNVSELARIVTRLTVLSDAETLTLEDLRRHAPELAREPGELPVDRWRLADRLLQGDLSLFADLHPGVQKAVAYLVGHYQGPVSLGAAARHACLTPSHLSVLCHKSLGCTFRDLLAALRIQKAKQLLAAQPRLSITEVCFEVGFSEMSTFERTFKRFVECGPREFRDRAALKRRPGVSGSSPSPPPSAPRKPNP